MAGAKRLGPDPRISTRRAARLYRLLTTLNQSGRSRPQLVKLGRAGMRTFYRDLTVLDDCKIEVRLMKGQYCLMTALDTALNRLPFPTPELTFGDVFELSKGRTAAHAKLRGQVQALTG